MFGDFENIDDEDFSPASEKENEEGEYELDIAASVATRWSVDNFIMKDDVAKMSASETAKSESVAITVNKVTESNRDHEIVSSAFSKLMDRATTDGEKARLLDIQNNLGLKSSDSLWLMLLQFESYNSSFNLIPEKISTVVESCVEKLELATKREISRANIEIKRKEKGIEYDIESENIKLKTMINELFAKLFDDQKITVNKEVERKYNLKKWSVFLVVALTQMLVIISTNVVVFILASHNSSLPWYDTSVNSSANAWLFQAFWNFPSGWVLSALIISFGIFYIYYDNFKKI